MENLESKTETSLGTEVKPSLGDFTRKSVVGAAYRVGASFTMDAFYLTAAGVVGYYLADRGAAESLYKSASDFATHLEIGKLARVAAFVVGINFIDYRFNITERLDSAAKRLLSSVKKKK